MRYVLRRLLLVPVPLLLVVAFVFAVLRLTGDPVAIYLGLLFLLGTYLTQTYGPLIAAALLHRMALGDSPGVMLLLLWTFLGMAAGPIVAANRVLTIPGTGAFASTQIVGSRALIGRPSG